MTVMVALIALFLLVGLVVMIMLLANPKTRGAAAGVLSIVLLVLVVGAGWWFLSFRAEPRQQTAHVPDPRFDAQSDLHQHVPTPELGTRPPSPVPPIPAAPENVGPGSGAAAVPESDPLTVQARAVLRALMRALGTGGAEAKKKKKVARADEPDAPDPEAAPADENQPAAPARPAWVDGVPHRVGNVYQTAIKIDPCPTREECEDELPEQARKAVAEYADTKLNFGPRIAQELQLPWNYIQKNIIKQQWPEPVATVSYGTWVQLHALLEFDHEVRKHINDECNKLIVSRRLWYTGTGVVAGLALLSVLFAGLKIDQATGGSYRGRLGLAGVVAVLAVVAAAYFAVSYVQGPPIANHPTSPGVTPVESAWKGARKSAGRETQG